MAAPTLSIAPISASLPSASPNLMPFHIKHTGPAPISTYFLVEAASEHVAKAPPSPATASDQDVAMADPEAETEATSPASAAPPAAASLSRRVTEATTRFIATFRGRTMQGLKVELPAGYSGVLMAGEATAGANKLGALKTRVKQAVKAKKAGRATRSATRDDDEADGDETHDPEDQTSARTLMPTAQFSSFVLWHPDIPVDPGRDEYLRSLTEWIRLADEIHRLEE
ncbi:ribonuclease H2, subunit C [Mycena rosella]|uniref:Ribonuclease H2, subunit C n=1 Tax=Mycena rosella TaxID=1033263 RepID=A0AAD7MB27_MYCRO|nr:ribonuclease H2, subunit C [Mycena rosella]